MEEVSLKSIRMDYASPHPSFLKEFGTPKN
jgi:hypothetical protein